MKSAEIKLIITSVAKMYRRTAVNIKNDEAAVQLINEVESRMMSFINLASSNQDEINAVDAIKEFKSYYENGYSPGTCASDYFIKSICAGLDT